MAEGGLKEPPGSVNHSAWSGPTTTLLAPRGTTAGYSVTGEPDIDITPN